MKIVVIEDHALVLNLLVKARGEAVDSSQYFRARDVASGVALCREHLPDLLILDVAFPDGDGLDFRANLRSASSRTRSTLLCHQSEPVLCRIVNQGGFSGVKTKVDFECKRAF